MIKLKAPRIYHLPWSEVVSNDDKFIKSTSIFEGKEVVVTLKLDGENTSLYNDGTFHAKSLDSKAHESRDWIHTWWRDKLYTDNYLLVFNKYKDLRLVGENLKACHTIEYNNLKSFFVLHSIWNGSTCLSWEDTVLITLTLNLQLAPVLYSGLYTEKTIKKLDSIKTYDNDLVEGYVIRNSNSFEYNESNNNIAKFVSSTFEIKGDHWNKEAIRFNKLYEV